MDRRQGSMASGLGSNLHLEGLYLSGKLVNLILLIHGLGYVLRA